MGHGKLSMEDIKSAFHLDGRLAGSVARFVNHSDEPNLSIAMVIITNITNMLIIINMPLMMMIMIISPFGH
jgi:SET domain-containing protein